MEVERAEKAELLARRAIAGDAKALRKLKRVSPQVFERLLDGYADLGKQTQTALIEAIYLRRWGDHVEGDRLAVASLERQAEEMRELLFEVHTTPLERLLADRVVCCWLAVSQADIDAASWPENRFSENIQKYVDRAHRRFSRACKDLATVSRLLGPVVQVNVAREQRIANIFSGGEG
ncbi:MAG: hypothetical protein O2954_06860 [bacterium]|nr:hypothetical protein [bacterium]